MAPNVDTASARMKRDRSTTRLTVILAGDHTHEDCGMVGAGGVWSPLSISWEDGGERARGNGDDWITGRKGTKRNERERETRSGQRSRVNRVFTRTSSGSIRSGAIRVR